MLTHAPVHTTLAVTNLERAIDFYVHKLGLKQIPGTLPEGNDAGFECGGGTHLYLYVRGEPSGSTATACSFEAEDVPAVVNALQNNGVTFEEYNIPEMDLVTKNGIATMGDLQAAWFKDPDGNILAVSNNTVTTQKTPTAATH